MSTTQVKEVILLICTFLCQSYGSNLIQLLQFLGTEENIIVVSDIQDSAWAGPKVIQQQLSFIRSERLKDFINERERKEFLKIIVDLPNVESTVQFISQIGEATDLQNLTRGNMFWVLLVWPVIEPHGELIINQYFNSPRINMGIDVSSEFYIGFPRSNVSSSNATNANELFEFFEIYGLNSSLIINQVSDLRYTFMSCKKCLTHLIRRSDFNGIQLKVEGVEDPEFKNDTEFHYDERENKLTFTHGFSVDILFMLQQALNFSVTCTKMNASVAKEVHGAFSAWDGMVYNAEKGNIDIGISLTVQLPSRKAREISFLPATDEYIVSAFFKPPPVTAIRDIFLQPFKPDLWAAVISTWLVLAFSMILFSVIRKRVGATDENDENEPDFTQNSLIWAVATACQQGWDEHPTCGSLRTLFISGSFTGLVAYAGYSAAIVSTLSLRIDPIQNPQQLIDSSLSIGVRFGFLDKLLADNETNDVVRKVYDRLSKIPEERFVNVSDGFRILNHKQYAFISIRDTFYDVVKGERDLPDQEVCQIHDLQILQRGFPAGAFVPNNSIYKDFFQLIIDKLRERGILWRLRNFYSYTRRCMTNSDSQGIALKANDVFTAFMILVAGYVLSATFLFIEKLFFVNKLTYIQ